MQAVPTLLNEATATLPLHLRSVLTDVHAEIRALETRIADLERELRALAAADRVVERLMTIPGICVLTATARVGSVVEVFSVGVLIEFVMNRFVMELWIEFVLVPLPGQPTSAARGLVSHGCPVDRRLAPACP